MAPTLTPRQTFREVVAQVAEKARAKLPQNVNGRIESAVRLVLQGDVEPQADGTITVGSSDPTRYYRLTGQACTCTDFSQGKAPQGWCKHRIAAGIQKRVREMLPPPEPGGVSPTDTTPPPDAVGTAYTAPQGVSTTDTPALPEAPASVNVRLQIDGRDCQLTLRDSDEARLLQRLAVVLQQYPVPQPAPQTPPQGQGKDWCPLHQTAMRQTTKEGRSWFSHKVDGRWCKGK